MYNQGHNLYTSPSRQQFFMPLIVRSKYTLFDSMAVEVLMPLIVIVCLNGTKMLTVTMGHSLRFALSPR